MNLDEKIEVESLIHKAIQGERKRIAESLRVVGSSASRDKGFWETLADVVEHGTLEGVP